MAIITLRPASIGDLNEIVAYVGDSVLSALSDDSDLTYANNSGDVKRTLCYLQAHGQPAGSIVNSVVLKYRGRIQNAGNNFTGIYKRVGDGSETNDTLRNDSAWAEYNPTIPAPGGGWTLTALTGLQVGARLFGNVGAPDFAQMADVWVEADIDAPPAMRVYSSMF